MSERKPSPTPVTATAADRREAAAEELLTAPCVPVDASVPDRLPRPLAPPPRRGETAAHLLLKRLALFWAQKQGYHSCAFEVSLPNCRYRADLAAYMPSKGKVKVRAHDPALPALTHKVMVCHTLGSTAVFECKQARSDFLKDSRSTRETLAELKDLHARRIELERTLRVHYPTLRVSDSLFQDYESNDFGELEHANYKKVLARITLLQKRMYQQTKFDTLVRYRCGNLFYVVAEDGIFQPHEIPLHWGLLVRRADRLELREKPVWQNLDDHERLALLAQDRRQRHPRAQPRGGHHLRANLGSAAAGRVRGRRRARQKAEGRRFGRRPSTFRLLPFPGGTPRPVWHEGRRTE